MKKESIHFLPGRVIPKNTTDMLDTLILGRKVSVSNIDLSFSVIERLNFLQSRLEGLRTFKTRYIDCDLSNADLTGGVFNECKFSSCIFMGVELSSSKWSGCDLPLMELAGSNLAGASFFKSNLKSVNFSGCNLSGAEFIECDLRGANFMSAGFNCTEFRRCVLDDGFELVSGVEVIS